MRPPSRTCSGHWRSTSTFATSRSASSCRATTRAPPTRARANPTRNSHRLSPLVSLGASLLDLSHHDEPLTRKVRVADRNAADLGGAFHVGPVARVAADSLDAYRIEYVVGAGMGIGRHDPLGG